ncbi:MAG: methylated-DNA--[protein]-cysteine S-methyltransferase [Sandaracinus sp.]
MTSTDPSKNQRPRITAEGCALLDFGHGPAPRLGCYAVFFVADGCVAIETATSEAAVDALAAELEIPRAPLPPSLAILAAFARGEPVDLATVPIVLSGPPFFLKVWKALRSVHRGEVCTYAHLARAARSPRAMRAVGQAMARNPLPLVVPCHRVIADHARLGGYTGGTDRKRALLALEGVEVDGDVVRPGQLDLVLDRARGPG